MKLYLEVMYDAISACELELPEGYTHDDIDDIWVRYEDATIRFKDGTTFETEIEYPEYDYSQPIYVKTLNEDFDVLETY